MRILVSGASGFIGSSLIKYLRSNSSIEIFCISRSEVSLNESLSQYKNIHFFSCDLTESFIEWPKHYEKFDAVINFASQQPTNKNITEQDFYETNIKCLTNLWKQSLRRGMSHFIHFSSTSVYPQNYSLISVDESSETGPVNAYGRSKLMSEKVLCELGEEDDIRFTIFRLPSVMGEQHLGGLMFTFFSLAKKNANIEIFNKGENYRNFLYIDDLISALNVSIDMSQNKDIKQSETYLLGSLNSLKSIEIARLVVELMQSNSEIIPIEKNILMDGNIILDLTKSINRLGFKPNSLESGITSFLRLHGYKI